MLLVDCGDRARKKLVPSVIVAPALKGNNTAKLGDTEAACAFPD
jgi:hypothetical protein